MKYTVLTVPGTGESHPGDTRIEPVGMLKFVTDCLDPAVFEGQNVGYPADFGFIMDEVDSINVGGANLAAAIRATPNPVILLGYSQGCQVVRKLIGDIASAAPNTADLEVVAAGLIADPWRPYGVQEGPYVLDGYGIAGAGPGWGDMRVWEIAAATDGITNSSAGSLIRPMADVLKFFTALNPAAWVKSIFDMVQTNGWQSPPPAVTPAAVMSACSDLLGYSVLGHHQQYNIAPFPGVPGRTYCGHLADLITARFVGAQAAA